MKEWKNKIVEVRKGKKEGEKKKLQNWTKLKQKKVSMFLKKRSRIELDRIR
jgi:hypothetical protein